MLFAESSEGSSAIRCSLKVRQKSRYSGRLWFVILLLLPLCLVLTLNCFLCECSHWQL